MTREELEAAGYVFSTGDSTFYQMSWEYVMTPDEWQWESSYGGEKGLQDCLEAATAHYEQQQELAHLRVLKGVVDNVASELYVLANETHSATITALVDRLNAVSDHKG